MMVTAVTDKPSPRAYLMGTTIYQPGIFAVAKDHENWVIVKKMALYADKIPLRPI